MTLSTTALCNLALAEVPAAAIISIADNTPRAELCRLIYPQVIAELMELEFSFAIRREPLTLTTNTRSDRWGYAYAVPNGLGYPLRLRPLIDNGSYVPMVGQSIAISPWSADPGITFDIEGGLLWANSGAVELEFVDLTPDFSRMTASFEKAVTFGLAARLSMGITKDRTEANKLVQMAEVYRDRALAADLNRNASQNRYGDNYVPEVMLGYLWAPE